MLKWRKHPILPVPTDEEMAAMEPEELYALWQMREEAMDNATQDPLEYGLDLDPWKDADKLLEQYDEVLVLGGNRSSKTRFGARTCNKAGLKNSDGLILCFGQDEKASIRTQQKAVHEWLPLEYKSNTRSDQGYIKYSMKNGFTGNDLILPKTRTTIAFHYYSQFLQNPGKFEGIEVGSLDPEYTNIGLWLDEYLLGPGLVDTLRFRLATRDAKLLVTFTTIDGMTEFVAEYLKGAETIKDRYVDRFEKCTGTVPYIQKCKNRNAAIIYFHSDMNPYGGYQRLEKDLKGRSKNEILTRFYGVPVKMMTGQFPTFKRSVNVMKHSDMLPIIKVDSKVTRYQIIDPAPNKRWYCVWIAVDEEGNWYVYRDWPDKSYGDWAEMGEKNKSRLAEASKPDGKGIKDYVELFEVLEHGEKIYERLIDPRMGATPRQVEDGTTTIIQQLEESGCVVLPAPGGLEDHGLAALRDKMKYNELNPVDAVNRPQFYISDQCEQTIDCLLNYTAAEGPTEAWKDGIDCLRYAAASEIYHVAAGSMNTTRFGTGGY